MQPDRFIHIEANKQLHIYDMNEFDVEKFKGYADSDEDEFIERFNDTVNDLLERDLIFKKDNVGGVYAIQKGGVK